MTVVYLGYVTLSSYDLECEDNTVLFHHIIFNLFIF